jgi:hypothetical protein
MKLIDDTLKIKGKYSMKRVLVAVSFPYTLLLGIYIVISDRLLGLKTVNPFAIQVFLGMLAFITGAIGVSAFAKVAEMKEQNNNTNNLE